MNQTVSSSNLKFGYEFGKLPRSLEEDKIKESLRSGVVYLKRLSGHRGSTIISAQVPLTPGQKDTFHTNHNTIVLSQAEITSIRQERERRANGIRPDKLRNMNIRTWQGWVNWILTGRLDIDES